MERVIDGTLSGQNSLINRRKIKLSKLMRLEVNRIRQKQVGRVIIGLKLRQWRSDR